MSLLLFYTFMVGCMRKIEVNVGNEDARLEMNGMDWLMVACLFANDTIFFVD